MQPVNQRVWVYVAHWLIDNDMSFGVNMIRFWGRGTEPLCDYVPAGDAELQKVPGNFASVEDYAKVFEPLLFEECRAQLHNSWEELLEGTVGDPHAGVTIKNVERRERGNQKLQVSVCFVMGYVEDLKLLLSIFLSLLWSQLLRYSLNLQSE